MRVSPQAAAIGLGQEVQTHQSPYLESTHLHGHGSIERDQQDHESDPSQDGGTQVLRRHGQMDKTDN